MGAGDATVTVFGGTGFLGHRIARHLAEQGFAVRAVSRHPERAAGLFGNQSGIQPFAADVNDDRSVAAVVAGARFVVNAVSLYLERGQQTFQSVHVKAAGRVARLAQAAGVERLLHVSGVGSDATAASPYIRSRGQGELVVRKEFPAATLIRPTVMFGRGDAFLVPIARNLKRLPIFPLFGSGETKLQPAHVEDVAEAMSRIMARAPSSQIFELGGPRIYVYRLLIEMLAEHVASQPLLVPFPFGIWHSLAYLAEMLPRPPITRNQVELIRIDNMVSAKTLGFDALQIMPSSIEEILPIML